MKRYYLIRRKLETFLGPMTLEEMRTSFQKLEFGGQDEVCGHCGKWVVIEDSPRLRQHYPEVSDALSNPLVGGWAASSGHEGAAKIRKSKKPTRRRSVVGFAMIAVVCGLVAGVAAFVLNNQELSSKFLDDNLPLTSRAKSLVDAQQWDDLRNYIGRHREAISSRASKSKSSYEEWIPYLRAAAYLNDGEVEGIRSKLLQGPGKFRAPADCSVDAWRRRWSQISQAEFESFLSGNLNSKKLPMRTLMWDPHWIRRRKAEGWIIPSNYYAFCLEMSKKGWNAFTSEIQAGLNPNIKMAVERRLNTQISIINSTNIAVIEGGNDILRILNCMDQTETESQTSACKTTVAQPDMSAFVDAYESYAKIRIITDLNETLSEEQLSGFESITRNITPAAPLTGLDYMPEYRFAKLVMLNMGRVGDAASKASSEFRDMIFLNH
jgi:hypothetical protein